jgi:hypothetical protein
MRPIELAEDFTLGDLCRMIRDFAEVDVETFSALVQCPLEPFIEECLKPYDAAADSDSELHSICLHWICEYENATEDCGQPSASLWLDVDGIGDIWQDCKPGGQLYVEGKDFSNCNRYGIELTPLYKLRHLPIRIDPTMTIRCTGDEGQKPLEIPAPDVTLLQIIYYVFWELSFFGTPENRDATVEELQETKRRIDAGEQELIPLEDLMREFDETKTESQKDEDV